MNLISKIAVFVLVLGGLQGAQAQNYETTLTGTILDTTGAKVTNATVTITNSGTKCGPDVLYRGVWSNIGCCY